MFINYFSITIVEFNLQTGRPVCMSLTLEGHEEDYVKLSMRWCKGWVRTGRVASLSSRYKSRKAQPFGFHFDFGFCLILVFVWFWFLFDFGFCLILVFVWFWFLFDFGFGFCRPIPSNINLKKESPVCISFTFEGHRDHYEKRAMWRRRGWVRTTRVTSLSSRFKSRKALEVGQGEKKSYKRREKRR